LKKKIKDNFKKMKHFIGSINGFMAENISGMRIVQIFKAEKEKHDEFVHLNDEYYKTTVFQVWLNSILRPAADIFQSISVAIIIWYGMGKITNQTLEIGVLYAFTTYIKQFFNPISDLADNYTTIQSALVSADRIFELIDQEDILEDLDAGMSMEQFEGNIEFKSVWFSYNDENWILKDISFKLNKGQTAAFVGETGAGKTTIISLISGFYKVQRGQILIDGININDIKLRDLRKNIAVVLQDVFLFSGNIENNITLNDEISSDVIEEALQLSCAEDFVSNMPQGLQEPVMERGSTFSAGQKQLLSFARGLAHTPTVLVLDEATANIDTKTEKLIQKAIENFSKDRTTLVIAHRLSTIRNADKIIVLKHGKIVEMGNHGELMEADGYYKSLIDKSSSEMHMAG
jgi:ATP-binding cassette subfamily B protein